MKCSLTDSLLICSSTLPSPQSSRPLLKPSRLLNKKPSGPLLLLIKHAKKNKPWSSVRKVKLDLPS